MSNPSSLESERMLVMGLCTEGPYRYATDNLENPAVKWISWGYDDEWIHPAILQDLDSGKIRQGTRVVFCRWNLSKENLAGLLRKGVIDYVAHHSGYVSFTVFLGELVSGFIQLPEKDHFLCRYVVRELQKGGHL